MPTEITPTIGVINGASEAVEIITKKSIENGTDADENEVAMMKISLEDMNEIGDEEFHKIVDAIVGPYDSHSDDAVSSLFSSDPIVMSSLSDEYKKIFSDMENKFQIEIEGIVLDDKLGRVTSDTDELTTPTNTDSSTVTEIIDSSSSATTVQPSETVTEEPKSSAEFISPDYFKLAVKDAVKSAVSEIMNEVIVDIAKDILHRFDANKISESES